MALNKQRRRIGPLRAPTYPSANFGMNALHAGVIAAMCSTAANAATINYTINTSAAPNAVVSTAFEHNQLSGGLTTPYGSYQTVFPSMNDLGVVVGRLPASSYIAESLPISQTPSKGYGTLAAVWENGVTKRSTWPVNLAMGGLYDGYLTPTKQLVAEYRGCYDYYFDGIADNPDCAGRATAINNAGTVVGTAHANYAGGASTYYEYPQVWPNALATNGPAYPGRTLSTWAISNQSHVIDINEQGSMVGTGITNGGAGPMDTYEHGLVDVKDVSNSYYYVGVQYQRSRAHAINDSNVVTGAALYNPLSPAGTYNSGGTYVDPATNTTKNYPWYAYSWSNGVISAFLKDGKANIWNGTAWVAGTSYSTATYSEAYAINNNGVKAGVFVAADGYQHAFQSNASNQMDELLKGPTFSGNSIARSINNAGVIVGTAQTAAGYRAFIYTGGQMRDLNDQTSATVNVAGIPSGWVLTDAFSVNNKNQILVRASNGSQEQIWVLSYKVTDAAADQGSTIATAERVNLNSDTASNFSSASDLDYYQLVLPNAGKLTVYVTNTSNITPGSVLDSAGTQLANGSITDMKTATSFDLDAGTYYVKATGPAGNYSFLSRFVADDSDTVDAKLATVMKANDSKTGRIGKVGDVDVYKVYVPSLGTLLASVTGPTGTTATVLDRLGNVPAAASNPGGIYFVKVANTAGQKGDYTLTTSYTAYSAVDDAPDALGTNATVITPGTEKSGVLGTFTDVDFYQFTVPTTTTASNVSVKLSNLPAYFTLYNSSGTVLSPYYGYTSGTDPYAYLVKDLAPGTYYVGVKANGNAVTGTYKLLVRVDSEGSSITNHPGSLTLGTAAAPANIDFAYDNPAGIYEKDYDYFKVVVPTAGYLTVQSSGTGGADVAGTLLDSSGYSIGSNNNYTGLGTHFKLAKSVAAGTYYVAVNGSGVALTGAYSIAASYSTTLPTETGGGNSTGAASVIQTSSQTTGTVNNVTIDYIGDIDYYSVTTSKKGYVKATLVNPTADTKVSIVDVNGNVLSSNVGSSTFTVAYAASAAGTYYVKVEGNGTVEPTYTLTTAFTADDYTDSKNDPAITTLTLGGSVVSGNLYPGDYDVFKVVLSTAQTLTVNAATTYIYFTDVNGYQTGPSAADELVLNLNAGTYYVNLFNNTTGFETTYALTASATATVTDDAANTYSGTNPSPKPITLATYSTTPINTSGNFETSNDVDYFKLDVQKPGWLDIGTSGSKNTTIYLKKSDDTTLWSNADGGGTWGVNGHLAYGLVDAGTYYLRVENPQAKTGAYNVVSTFTALPADDHGNKRDATATALTLASPKAGKINFLGDVDYFSFVAPTAGTYNVAVAASWTMALVLYDAAGTQLAQLCTGYWDYCYGGNLTINSPALTAGSTYYVKLLSYGDSTGVTYNLTVKAN